MPPRVLISDALSPPPCRSSRLRGVDVDFQPTLGKDKEKLAAIIGDYDGLAIRSATKVTADILREGARGSRSSAAPASASTMSMSPPRPRAASS